jgi:hypothetical protein
MTYIKSLLPELEVLVKMYDKNPDEFIEKYKRYEILQGSYDSVSFVNKKLGR